jgi:hypothetical protein
MRKRYSVRELQIYEQSIGRPCILKYFPKHALNLN